MSFSISAVPYNTFSSFNCNMETQPCNLAYATFMLKYAFLSMVCDEGQTTSKISFRNTKHLGRRIRYLFESPLLTVFRKKFHHTLVKQTVCFSGNIYMLVCKYA